MWYETCVRYVQESFDFSDSLFLGTFTIQNVGDDDEHDLYTFQFPSGSYLMVTQNSYNAR